MDRQTVYVQQLLQASDFLRMQRHMARALGTLAYNLFGFNPVAATIGANGTVELPVPGTGLAVIVPPITLYGFGVVDDTSWSSLGADFTQTFLQGINFGATQVQLTSSSPLNIGAGNWVYFLIQGQIQRADQDPAVLPYFPVIQVTTIAGSTTTQLKVNSTAGISDGDQIIVQGIATANGQPTFVNGTPPDNNTINLTNALSSAPGADIAVRDVTPNDGVPLSGPANSGTAQNQTRALRVTLTAKQGTPAPVPTIPPPDANFHPLYAVLVPNGATSVLAPNIVYAPNAPFFPGLIGAQHHKGIPGHAAKVNINGTESTYAAVNRAGDVMSGMLTLFADPTSPLHAATRRWTYQEIFNHIIVDGYTGNGTSQVVAAPAQLRAAIILATGSSGGNSGFITTSGQALEVLVIGSRVVLNFLYSNAFQPGGGMAMGNSLNVSGQAYIYIALRTQGV